MTRTTYYSATTLDGFLADEHDSLDWLFTQDHDEDGPMAYAPFIEGIGAIVMGATTYVWVLDHMAETGEAWAYDMPAWVMTHRDLPTPAGADIRFSAADDEDAIRQVHSDLVTAAGGKGVWVVGGGGLAADFAAAGLLDELVLSIAPVTLGAGKPLLPRPFDLRLVELARNGAFACASYEVLGPRP